MPISPKPKRRCLRYSLRTLLIVVTIGAAGFGWLGVKVRAKQSERETVKSISELGGQVDYDRRAPGPVWLQQWLGNDIFTPVNTVFCGKETTDADLVRIGNLHQLEELCLNETKITDAGLVHLRGLKKLRTLLLDGPNVTDAGLLHLQGLTELDDLHLFYTQVTDAGCAKLQKALPNLQIDR